MDEMVERVARAIFLIAQDEAVSRPSMLAAERAIAAMREPTKKMLDAGDVMVLSDYDVPVLWHQMIDAALADE